MEERFHVFERVDGHADPTDLTERERMIRVEADLRGEIERDGEAGLALAEEIAIALVGFDSGAKAGVLAHGPEAAAVHRRVNAAGKRKFAGIAQSGFGIPAGKILFGVQAVDREARESGEFFLALGEGGGFGLGVRHVRQRKWNRK